MPNPPVPASIFDEEAVNAILERVAAGETLPAILGTDRPEGWPCFKTWFNWLAKGNRTDAEPRLADLVQRYARACEARTAAQAEMMLYKASQPNVTEVKTARRKTTQDGFEDVEEVRIVDNTERTKIEIDAMKWTMAKMLPKKYGVTKQEESGGDKYTVQIVNSPDAD